MEADGEAETLGMPTGPRCQTGCKCHAVMYEDKQMLSHHNVVVYSNLSSFPELNVLTLIRQRHSQGVMPLPAKCITSDQFTVHCSPANEGDDKRSLDIQ